MSAPKENAPGPQKEVELEPLTENEMGEAEGGFTELSRNAEDDVFENNAIACPGPMPNRSECM